MADDPPGWRRTLVAFVVMAGLTGAPAGAYWFERSHEVRHTVAGTVVVTGCSDGRCVGRFTSDDGVVDLEPVPVPGARPAGTVRAWLSPRERHPTTDEPRLWPATVAALALVLGTQALLAVLFLVDHRFRSRTGRPWKPARPVEFVLSQVFLVIVLGGMLALCSGVGAVTTAVGWLPGHVTGVECPESRCVGRFVPDDGSPTRTVDVPGSAPPDGTRRAWIYEGVTFDPPPDPILFLLLPAAGVVLFELWWLVDRRSSRRS